MSEDSIYWVSVNFDHPPTAEKMEEVADSIRDKVEHELIVTSGDIKPFDKAEIKSWLDELKEAVSDDE